MDEFAVQPGVVGVCARSVAGGSGAPSASSPAGRSRLDRAAATGRRLVVLPGGEATLSAAALARSVGHPSALPKALAAPGVVDSRTRRAAALGPSAARRPAAPRRPGRPPLRLTRRGRVVVVLVAAALLTVGVSLARVASSASTPEPARPAPAARVHVVAPGETLWQIAAASDGGGDVRVAVARLMAFNHLDSASVRPGQAIRLP